MTPARPGSCHCNTSKLCQQQRWQTVSQRLRQAHAVQRCIIIPEKERGVQTCAGERQNSLRAKHIRASPRRRQVPSHHKQAQVPAKAPGTASRWFQVMIDWGRIAIAPAQQIRSSCTSSLAVLLPGAQQTCAESCACKQRTSTRVRRIGLSHESAAIVDAADAGMCADLLVTAGLAAEGQMTGDDDRAASS
jgi:hypothetical protein